MGDGRGPDAGVVDAGVATAGPEEPELPLLGGTANRGRVFRVGDTVRRPWRPTAAAVRRLLDHLAAVGFTGAPRWLGRDEHGREVLSYVEGTAITPPYPSWALTEAALVSVAELLRDYHRAVASFDPGEGWPPSPPHDYAGGIVCHNDPNLDNVVFRDGRAVALIDFDLASPGHPLWDVACAARLWVPLRPDRFIHDSRRGHVPDRLRLFVEAYGLDEALRPLVVDAARQNHRWLYDIVALSAAGGHPAFGEYWTVAARERAEACYAWLADSAPMLRSALA